MGMTNEEITAPRARFNSAQASPRAGKPGPVIDQEGREIPESSLRGGFRQLAKLLDVAFMLPGTKIRYGVDGVIRLIPVVGDLLATAFSLWLVREARALGAPWHVTARMLGNVAVDGVVGIVPIAGDAFDVLFRANMRNVRLLRRWLDRQPR